MSDDLDQLRKLAKEAIEIKKRIKVDTDKLQTVKNEFIERSKNRNSSYTIAVDDGSIRIIKYKRTIYYNLNQKGFDKTLVVISAMGKTTNAFELVVKNYFENKYLIELEWKTSH